MGTSQSYILKPSPVRSDSAPCWHLYHPSPAFWRCLAPLSWMNIQLWAQDFGCSVSFRGSLGYSIHSMPKRPRVWKPLTSTATPQSVTFVKCFRLYYHDRLCDIIVVTTFLVDIYYSSCSYEAKFYCRAEGFGMKTKG